MKSKLEFIPIKTRHINPPKDDLLPILDESLTDVRDGDIILFSSKVVSIHQGRCIPHEKITNKDELIITNSDLYIQRNKNSFITVIHNAFSLNAGIDGVRDYTILLPDNPQKTAHDFHSHIKKRFSLNNVGIIITDSHSAPLRRGVLGFAVGFWGINPLYDASDRKDFSRTTVNIVDTLAGIGNIYMGESQSKHHPHTPIVIIRNFTNIEFIEQKNPYNFFLKQEEDLFSPLLKFFRKGKSSTE